jgi:hypothetical protein
VLLANTMAIKVMTPIKKMACISEPAGLSEVICMKSFIKNENSIASAIHRRIFISVLTLMIDASYRLAYPLEQKLEGIASATRVNEGDNTNWL